MAGTRGQVNQGTVRANGADLSYEVRGNGPSVVLVTPGALDAGFYQPAAEQLADEFTVLTYDRRGQSRSPRPARWTATSVGEQADDAAELVRALGLAPAAAFGSSSGAVILLDAAARHADTFRGVIENEPPMFVALSRPDEVMAQIQQVIGPALEAMARFIIGDAVLDGLDASLRERLRANAEVFFTIEMESFMSYAPDEAALRASAVPVIATVGAETRDRYPFFHEAAAWAAARIGSDLVPLPGGHNGFVERPVEWAEAIRPLLRKLS